ncbi:MAG: tryptophan 7-halogenase [Nannocystaceae bacterium]
MDLAHPDVLVVGSSISGLMVAAWLKLELPELDVVVLGPPPERERRPYVGESLVEPAILFFRELGLGEFLDTRCALKNGLTFYHKLAPDDPDDRRYTVHAPERLHHLARQLHRPDFDRALRARAAELGVRLVDGHAEEVAVGADGRSHRVRARIDDASVDLEARFLVDASGRRRLIGHQVTTYHKPEVGQRSAFWIRLADFEPFLGDLSWTSRRPHAYDLWDSTHHFMGRGNWVWGIPLASPEHRRLISLGITYRPDVFPDPAGVRSVEGLIAHLDREHPALAAMIRGGRVLDHHVYRDYIYWADQVYSADGWFLVGDAARAVDPLYSTGLSMTSIQALQIAAMIRGARSGALVADDVAALEGAWMKVARRRQVDITDQYETMHDPFQACMRRYWNICGWFNGLLPLWWNGFFSEPAGARLIGRLFAEPDEPSRSAWSLFGAVSRALGPGLDQAVFDRTSDLDVILNHRFDCPLGQVPIHLSRMFRKRARLRLSLVRLGGLGLLPGQLRPLARDLVAAGAARVVLPRIGREAFRRVTPPLHRLIAAGVAGERAR